MASFSAIFVRAFPNRIVTPHSCLRCSDLSMEGCGLNWDTATKAKTHLWGFTHMSQILQSQHISSLGSVCLSSSILEYSSARVFVLFFWITKQDFMKSVCVWKTAAFKWMFPTWHINKVLFLYYYIWYYSIFLFVSISIRKGLILGYYGLRR